MEDEEGKDEDEGAMPVTAYFVALSARQTQLNTSVF